MNQLPHKRLAEGEATGHFHAAVADDATLYGDDSNQPALLSAPSGSQVTHQEHGVVTLPPGDYDVRIVQEYDYAAEEARGVMD